MLIHSQRAWCSMCIVYLQKLHAVPVIADPCDVKPCANGGTCVPSVTTPDNFTCTCSEGFIGSMCENGKLNKCSRYVNVRQEIDLYGQRSNYDKLWPFS